ncbi:MAG: EF-P beta-lysylation protein EpmB [Pseudomonadota bacterium]
MIPRTADWKNALADAVRDPAELLALLNLPQSLLPKAREAARQFPLRVTRSYLSRIRKGDIGDPLLRQVLPLEDELADIPGFEHDPVGDLGASATPGVLHKYHGRALLTATGACAIHCRYCFRRHFPYGEENPGKQNWQGVVDYLQARPELEELILSGGDPLMLDTPQLEQLSRRLASQPQLKRLRLHTRMPVVLPERIDTALIDWLAGLPWQVVVVIHCNHPAEIDSEVANTLHDLHAKGVTLLNQSVLLRGVNDNENTLLRLHEKLFKHRVIPYYLHLLDRVSGAAHFEVSERKAGELLHSLRQHSPGYLVPKLVREIEGEPHKRPMA